MTLTPEELSEIRRQGALRSWADPEIRGKRLDGLKEAGKNEKRRRECSERLKALWTTPEFRAFCTERARAMWQDPEMRERLLSNHPRGNTRGRAKAIGNCVYCGNVATERDHDIPKSRGGTNDPENIVLACMSCNASKGRLTGDEFRATLSYAPIEDAPK